MRKLIRNLVRLPRAIFADLTGTTYLAESHRRATEARY